MPKYIDGRTELCNLTPTILLCTLTMLHAAVERSVVDACC